MSQRSRKQQGALRHQRAAARKSARRSHGGAALAASPRFSDKGLIRASGGMPLQEALITRHWRNTDELTQIIIARRAPMGRIVAAVFLVDLACLGVKNVLADVFSSPADYQFLRDTIRRGALLDQGKLKRPSGSRVAGPVVGWSTAPLVEPR